MRKPILLTLAWRLRTIGCLALWGFAAMAVGIASAFAQAIILGTRRLMEGTPYPYPTWAKFGDVPAAWIAGVGLGFVIAWTAHELLRCPIAATLPRLRQRLTVEVVLALAVVWLLLLWGLDSRRGPAVFATCAATGFLGGGVGLLVASPTRFRSLWSASALVVGLTPVSTLLQWAQPWMLEHASAVVPVLAVLGVGAIALAFSAGEHRRFLASDETGQPDPVALDMSHRDRRVPASWAPTWKRGRDWARATLHELHGASPFGWSFEVGKYFVVFVALQLLIQSYTIGSVFRENDRLFGRTLLTFWLLVASMWSASVPSVPRVGVVRPASRAERARSAWAVGALRTGSLLAAITVLAAAFAGFAAWRSAGAGRPPLSVRFLPDVLGAIAIVGIVAPWAAWIRLRLLDLWTASGRFPNPFRQGLVATATVVACEVAGHLLGNGWRWVEETEPAVDLPLFTATLVGSWLAYRAVLDRLFRTVALPV